jgi:thiamine-phosphate pyrophosphorylase
MTFAKPFPTLCLIADAEASASKEILPLVRQAVSGGVDLVQLRGKSWSGRQFLENGLILSRFLRSIKIPLIINDRVDIALACGADGVHLGQDDLPLQHARKLLGKNKIIGISVSTADEAIEAEKNGADYVGLGPIFPTPSKETPLSPLGIEGLRLVRGTIRIPILAIGGISAHNARGLLEAGADGIAVISAILGAPDIRAATQELRKVLNLDGKAKAV